MTRHLTIAAAALLTAIAETAPAAAERLVTSISRHQVHGELELCRHIDRAVRHRRARHPDRAPPRRRLRHRRDRHRPEQTLVERRKERVLGIWINIASRTFVNVPCYLAVLSNQPLEQITNAETLRQLQLGLADKLLPQELGSDVGDAVSRRPVPRQFRALEDAASSSTRRRRMA